MQDIPSTFLELYRSGRFDYWGVPDARLEDRHQLLEARRHLVLVWGSIEWDRSVDEIVAYDGDEMVRPGLIPFAGDGYGNAYCWYPPWQQGEEPPVVFYYHDQEESELFANSFSECLCRCMLQHFARPEEMAEDPVAAQHLWHAHRQILDPYLDSSQRQLLDDAALRLSVEACEEADAKIAEKLGMRTLLGIPPTLDIDPRSLGFEGAVRHYEEVVSYLRELIEVEGRSEFEPELQKALADHAAAAATLDRVLKTSPPWRTKARQPRTSPGETVVQKEAVEQKPKEGDSDPSFVSWADLSERLEL